MSTKAIIGLVLAIVVLGGGAWYVSSHKGAAPAEEAGQAEQGTSEKGTLGALLALGGSLTCNVTMPTAGGESTGVVYISNGQVRSDVVAAVGDKQMAAHMIKNGDYLYSWTDAYPQGVKIKMTATTATSGQGYDPNQEVQYSCMPWVPDASKFEVPTTVTFMDVSAMKGPGAAVPN